MPFIEDIRREFASLAITPSTLRNLGLTFLVVLGLLGGIMLWRGAAGGWVFLGLGALCGALGLLRPLWLTPLFKVWMGFAVVMGWFVSRLILITVYYLVLTPTGLILRLMGKDLLDLKLKDRDSYWHRREGPSDPSRSEKMY